MTQSKVEKIKEELKSVPTEPGVYLWKNKEDEVIYVGKAKSLRARMRQYVNLSDDRAKIPMLLEQIDSFEYIVVKNESESLLLEKNLIEQYKPFFNADLKDDKSYPFIAISSNDPFPSIRFTREKRQKNVDYFGPYTNSKAARDLIDVLRKIVPICSSSCTTLKNINKRLTKKNNLKRIEYGVINLFEDRPCFDSTIGIGPGICCGLMTREDYTKNIEKAKKFLSGQRNEITNELKEQIDKCSSNLEFEKAARLKTRLDTIKCLGQTQNINLNTYENIDIIGFYREETIAGVHVLIVREGKIINSNEFVLNKGMDVPMDDLVHNFFLKFYGMRQDVGNVIIMRDSSFIDDTMKDWLSHLINSKHGAKVKIISPKRGVKFDLLKKAEVNAKHTLLRYKLKNGYDDERTNEALCQLESALALNRPPLRIESYDISTNHGSYTVASMVVFTNGKADKSQYRRFKIKLELDESNDFLSMEEVIARRFSKKNIENQRFGSKPDLIILDGGKPQLNAALNSLNKLGIDDISIVGLAKRDEEVFVTWQKTEPVVLPSGSASLYLIKNIRDEAHRFAITYHRKLMKKGMTSSILDEVEGIGDKRKKALLKYFGGFKNLKKATLEEIKEAKIVPDNVAHELSCVLKQYN